MNTSIKNTTLFVNHTLVKRKQIVSGKWSSAYVIKDSKIKSEMIDTYETFAPFAGLGKALTNQGHGSRDSSGKAIRARIKAFMDFKFMHKDQTQFVVATKGKKTVVYLLNIKRDVYGQKASGDFVVFEMVKGARVSITVHHEFINRRFKPDFEGKDMTHHVCTVKEVEKRGKHIRKTEKKIDVTSTHEEVVEAVVETQEVVNEIVDVTNTHTNEIQYIKNENKELKAQIAYLYEQWGLVAPSNPEPMEMFEEDECQFEDEHSANIKHSYRFN